MPPAASAEIDAPLAALAAVDRAAAAALRRRMRASPAAFSRATLPLRLREVAATAGCDGPWTWAIGDAHVAAFGTLAVGRARADEGPVVVFDLAEAAAEHPAPWAWDLLRCVASLVAASPRVNATVARGLTQAAIDRYREVMARAGEGDGEHGSRVYPQDLPAAVAALVARDAEPAVRRRWLSARVRGARLRIGDGLARDDEARVRVLPALAAACGEAPRALRLVDVVRRDRAAEDPGARRWLALAEEPTGQSRLLEVAERRPSPLAGIVAALPDLGRAPAGSALVVPLAGDPYALALPGAAWPLVARSHGHAATALTPGAVPADQRRDLVRLLATLIARFHLRGLELLGVDLAARAGAIADDAGRRGAQLAPLPAELARLDRASWRTWRG